MLFALRKYPHQNKQEGCGPNHQLVNTSEMTSLTESLPGKGSLEEELKNQQTNTTGTLSGKESSTNNQEIVQVQESTEPQDTVQVKVPIQTSLTYSGVVQKDQFPQRDQALVMHCVQGIPLEDYIYAVGDIVKPGNIKVSSRISNNRVCIHLSSKELLEAFTEKYDHLMIREQKIMIAPLETKVKKVVLANVSPEIPNTVIEDVIDNLEIKRESPITILRTSLQREGYGHILSWKRQFYTLPNYVSQLPKTIKINYDGINHYIFPRADVIKCFNCNKDGHIAKRCPKNLNQGTNEPNEHNQANDPGDEIMEVEITPPGISPQVNKRTHSDTSSVNTKQNNTGSPKKVKTPDLEDLDDKLKAAKDILDDPNSIITYERFKSLLENTRGTKEVMPIILEHTKNPKALAEYMKNTIHPACKNRSIRYRCTMLAKAINNPADIRTPTTTPVNSDDES